MVRYLKLVLSIFTAFKHITSSYMLEMCSTDMFNYETRFFYSHAPWCPACRSMTKQWETLALSSQQMGIQVAKIDVTENPSLSGRFFVTALPTIFHVINGEFRQYRGPRDAQTLEEFVVEKKWKNLETVPWYFYPDSFFMGAASYFFKLSHGLKVSLVKR